MEVEECQGVEEGNTTGSGCWTGTSRRGSQKPCVMCESGMSMRAWCESSVEDLVSVNRDDVTTVYRVATPCVREIANACGSSRGIPVARVSVLLGVVPMGNVLYCL